MNRNRFSFSAAGSLANVEVHSVVCSLAHAHRRSSLLGLVALLFGFALALPAAASNLILSRTVLEDPTGALTIADVAGHVTTPIGPTLSIANSNTVYWLCLQVRAPAKGSSVVLFIRPNFLNDVRLYEAVSGNPQTWKTQVTGNHYAYGARDRATISLGFVVDVATPTATYYLRIKTRSPAHLSVEALEPSEAEHKDHHRDLVMMFFGTAMFSLLLWAILSYFLDRQPVVGLFAIHQTIYTLFGIAITGYLVPMLPDRFPQLADSIELVLYCAISFTPVLFCRALFKPYEPPPLLMRGLNLLLGTFPLLLVLIALGYDTFAATANAVLIKFTWLYFVFVAFSLRTERTPSRRLLRIFFVAVLMSNAIFWFAGHSIRIASGVSLTGVQLLIVDGLIIGGLFALILHTRARQTLREAQQATLDLLLVQKQVEIEQNLKKQAELQAQTDYLTGLFNRRRFVELAEHELSRSVRFQRPFTLLMIDIDHFKTVNDTWGHSIGDIVLQQVAHLIRDTLRDEDIFGRTGGEEFAAVIVETDGDGALEVAQRLCATVADAILTPPGAEHIRVSISVGLAHLNGRNIDFDSLLNEADWAMYKAKEAGRNQAFVSE